MAGCGVATTLCAVLSWIPPSELVVDHHRMLSTINNTNTTGLDTGAVVGISVGAAILGLLLLIAAWYFLCQPRSSAPQYRDYAPAFNPTPEFTLPDARSSSSIFANLASAEELHTLGHGQPAQQNGDLVVELPLLTLGQKHRTWQ